MSFFVHLGGFIFQREIQNLNLHTMLLLVTQTELGIVFYNVCKLIAIFGMSRSLIEYVIVIFSYQNVRLTCDFSFGFYHKLLMYSPRLFKCDVCRECFLYEDGMIVHVNLVHECWRFQCDVCGECFLSKDDMIGHVNLVK